MPRFIVGGIEMIVDNAPLFRKDASKDKANYTWESTSVNCRYRLLYCTEIDDNKNICKFALAKTHT
jgi:hypothetical protein